MRDKSFIDTNIFIYAIDKDAMEKRHTSIEFLKDIENIESVQVSSQVIKELTNVVIKKRLLNEFQLNSYLDIFSRYQISEISLSTIKEAVRIKFKYQLSFFDSLIIASALENHCTKLYSEDMNNGQSIEGLKIINPFQN